MGTVMGAFGGLIFMAIRTKEIENIEAALEK